MVFPPSEKSFDIPSELVNGCNLFGGEIVAVCSNEILYTSDFVAYNPERIFSLINAWGSEQNVSIKKNISARRYFIFLDNCFLGAFFDPAYEIFITFLKFIKAFMALIASIHNTSLIFCKNHVDKWSFRAFPSGKINAGWHGLIDIKAKMAFSLFAGFAVISPEH